MFFIWCHIYHRNSLEKVHTHFTMCPTFKCIGARAHLRDESHKFRPKHTNQAKNASVANTIAAAYSAQLRRLLPQKKKQKMCTRKRHTHTTKKYCNIAFGMWSSGKPTLDDNKSFASAMQFQMIQGLYATDRIHKTYSIIYAPYRCGPLNLQRLMRSTCLRHFAGAMWKPADKSQSIIIGPALGPKRRALQDDWGRERNERMSDLCVRAKSLALQDLYRIRLLLKMLRRSERISTLQSTTSTKCIDRGPLFGSVQIIREIIMMMMMVGFVLMHLFGSADQCVECNCPEITQCWPEGSQVWFNYTYISIWLCVFGHLLGHETRITSQFRCGISSILNNH